MYNQTVKRFTHILLASQILIFCAVFLNQYPEAVKLKKLLPKEIKKTTFGQSLKDFEKAHPKAVDTKDAVNNFRYVYLEELDKGGIASIVYYFDADLPGNPLYEIIVNYVDEPTMELKANIQLGETNYSGKDGKSKEWKFDIKEDYPLHCWTFRNRIVYAYPILGTEWNEKGDIDL